MVTWTGDNYEEWKAYRIHRMTSSMIGMDAPWKRGMQESSLRLATKDKRS